MNMETQSDNNTFEDVILDTDSYHCHEEAYENQLDNDGMYEDNKYIQSLIESADLRLLQTDIIDKQLEENNELNLFFLFLSPSLLENIRIWTNDNLTENSKKKESVPKHSMNILVLKLECTFYITITSRIIGVNQCSSVHQI